MLTIGVRGKKRLTRRLTKAGEDAYKAAAKAKELARQAAEEVKKAGKEARDGWEDAKHNDPSTDARHANK
jgi:hypothetical protein